MMLIICSVAIILMVVIFLVINFPRFSRLLYGKVSIKFSSYIVIVTGCDTGFGALLAIALHHKGYFVIATTLTKEGNTQSLNMQLCH